MNNSIRFSETSLIKIISWLLQPAVLALGAVVILYGLIFWSVNKGVSVDEGYYLLGYLKDQQLGPSTTDFHRIVRTLFFFIPEDNVLMFRWTRVVLTIVFLLLFIWSAYRWVSRQLDFRINKTLFYSLGFLSGSMCFAYASPVIYYDNIQLLIYLLVFTILFLISTSGSKIFNHILLLLIGVIIVPGITNYPTSGIFLLISSMVFLAFLNYPSLKRILFSCLVVLIGMAIGVVFYSILIRNIIDLYNDAMQAYHFSTKALNHKYDSSGQLVVLGKYLLGLFRVVLPVLGLSVAYVIISRWKPIPQIINNILFGIILIFLTFKYSGFFSNILLLPIIILITHILAEILAKKEKLVITKRTGIAALLLMIPLLAVIGSNQRLEMKMIYFIPFWLLSYFILIAEFKKYLEKPIISIFHYAFIVTFFIIFASQGFLKHIHYNYSIKRSDHYIDNAERFTAIGVSEFQKRFYETGINELKNAGFKPGNEVLAFYETFMLVYAAGGYVPHRLTYSAELFTTDSFNIPPQKPKYLIINEYQIPMIKEFLANTGWNFPNGYNKTELGTDGQNLSNMGYNYILFSEK